MSIKKINVIGIGDGSCKICDFTISLLESKYKDFIDNGSVEYFDLHNKISELISMFSNKVNIDFMNIDVFSLPIALIEFSDGLVKIFNVHKTNDSLSFSNVEENIIIELSFSKQEENGFELI